MAKLPSVPTEVQSADELSPAQARRRFIWLFCGVLAGWFLLITLHKGEFWPFSRFPMFSQSGKPWRLGLVRELSREELAQPLLEVWEKELPGRPFPLHRHHINQDDLSAVIRPMWDGVKPEHTELLAQYFKEHRATQNLVLYLVRGALRKDHTVRIRFRPLAVMTSEGVQAVTVPPEPATP